MDHWTTGRELKKILLGLFKWSTHFTFPQHTLIPELLRYLKGRPLQSLQSPSPSPSKLMHALSWCRGHSRPRPDNPDTPVQCSPVAQTGKLIQKSWHCGTSKYKKLILLAKATAYLGNKILVEVMYFTVFWFEDSEPVKWLWKDFSYKTRKQSIL